MADHIVEFANRIQSLLVIIHSRDSSNQARQSAQAALDNAINDHPNLVIPASLHLLSGAGDSLGCHFALSSIGKSISKNHATMSDSEWQGLRLGLLALFNGAKDLPFFVMSKLVDVMCDVAIRTWPTDWPELLPSALSGNRSWAICLFARICDSLSEESLSMRCIAPERQLSLRIGVAQVAEQLCLACIETVQNSDVSSQPVFQWIIELINGLAVATKQSSFLIKNGLHDVLISAFINIPDANVKMICVEALGNFIQYLCGQSGRAYTLPRGSREQDYSLLDGIMKTCRRLLDQDLIEVYCNEGEQRDCIEAFFDLLTDIRKTSNIFGYFSDLTIFHDVLVETASRHPALQVQITALGSVDAMVRSKQVPTDERVLYLCFLACHDFYSSRALDSSPIPPASMFPQFATQREVSRRRTLCEEECEEEGVKIGEVVGKLKNVALLCIRHVATISEWDEVLIRFLRDILSEAVQPDGCVSKSYYPALLMTEAVATAIPLNDSKRGELSTIINVVTAQCPSGREQDYLWFLGKAGMLITQDCLQSVFDIVLRMDVTNNFQAQVAFISLCKNNPHSGQFVNALHQVLQSALGGEQRSWAIGAILSACAHGGVGAADNFAVTVFQSSTSKLNDIALETQSNLEDFAKRATPIFATFKAVLEVPLSLDISARIADELAKGIIPFCWTRLMRSPSIFEVGPNEYLSVLGSQYIQSANTASSTQMNSAFQLYLLVAQVTGLCTLHCSHGDADSIKSLVTLFDPSWNLRPSLINILVSNVSSASASVRAPLLLNSMIPGALSSLRSGNHPQDEFTEASFSKAAVAVVHSLLSALQITTDDELSVPEYAAGAKPALSQRQLKAQLRSRNRFSAISDDSTGSNTPQQQPIGHRIPHELLGDPAAVFSIVAECLRFRTDKAFRRMNQSVPTIITRWWNSASHDAALASRLINALPEFVVLPTIRALEMVRCGDPATHAGGQLHSYTTDRAVSGRRLASEFVDHATISLHGALSVMWRFAAGHAPRAHIDPMAVVASSSQLSGSIKMILDGSRTEYSNDAVMRIVSCAKEQSLESRATLKFIVESITKDEATERKDGSVSSATGKDVIRATSRDFEAPKRTSSGSPSDDQMPPGNLFDQ